MNASIDSTMAIIPLAILLTYIINFTQCQHLYTPMFYLAENRALLNFAYQRKTTSSVMICGRDCSFDSNCASFNYHTSSQVCELNNVTGDHSPTDFIQLQGNAYYDGSLRCSSCQMWYRAGHRVDGIYTIYPVGLTGGIQVYCEMEIDGGGWIVFQKRQDGSVDFYRDWADYKTGFGSLTSEFWLGNDILRKLTESRQCEMRVDLGGWENNAVWATWGQFAVVGEMFTLSVGSYDEASTAGDSMAFQNGHKFSTKDQNNDSGSRNCAVKWHGAWWFNQCSFSHLNGRYYHAKNVTYAEGIQWSHWIGRGYSIKNCTMKIRQVW